MTENVFLGLVHVLSDNTEGFMCCTAASQQGVFSALGSYIQSMGVISG